MKKLYAVIIALTMIHIADCYALNPVAGSEKVYDVPKFVEPSWEEEEFELCRKNQWLVLPDSIRTDTLVNNLVDAYNVFTLYHSIRSDCELHTYHEIYTGEGIKKIDVSIIENPLVRTLAENFKMNMAKAQKSQVPNFRELIAEFMTDIIPIYRLETLMGNDSIFNQDVFNASINHDSLRSDSFSLRCIDALKLAHDTLRDSANYDALPKLVEVLTAGQYSPLLFEAWKTWRAMICYKMSHIKDAYIPNEEYNRLRMIGCYTMLCHINDYPDDWVAVNLFLLMINERNVPIYGSCPYGNQSVKVFYEMFPELVPEVNHYQ